MSGRTPISLAKMISTFPDQLQLHAGEGDIHIHSIAPPDAAEAGSLVFVTRANLFDAALASNAAALVITPKQAPAAKARCKPGQFLVVSPNPEIAMADILKKYFLSTPFRNHKLAGRHVSAQIDPSAEIAADATIGPNAFIGPRVRLGARSYVGANAVIEEAARIGDDTTIHPLVYIGHSTVIGDRCEIMPSAVVGKEGYGYAHDSLGRHHRIPHLGNVIVEDDVHIGSGCTLDRGTFLSTKIGAGTKLDNQCHIAHNATIGRNCLITAGFVIAGSSSIGDNAIIGGATVVTGHISVTDNVQIGGLSAVTKPVKEPGQYGGNPLQPLQKYVKTKAAMTHLPELRRQVRRLLKEVFPNETEAPGTDDESGD